ncbi:MAG: polysaccharide biosynthesis tyrosine autokinase [Verrucomicrobiae bacterium]|nr:polysaccharide biosynthesis tyrosine autokinase [Verrucomicrobiae bacterium]
MDTSSSPSPGKSPGRLGDSFQLRRYWLVVLERRWLVFCTFALVVTLGALYAFKSPAIYEAVGRIQIDPETGGVLSLRDSLMWGVKDQDYLQTQYQSITSPTLIETVIQKLRLEEDPRYALSEDRIRAVTEDIQVDPVRLSRLVYIKARHTDPRRAADMVNTLMEAYQRQSRDRKMTKALSGLDLLKKESATAEKELTAAIEALHKYRVEKGMMSLVDDTRQAENVDLQALRNAQEDLSRQNLRTAEAEKIAEEAENWKAAGRDVADFSVVNQDPLVNAVKARIVLNESRLAELRTRYKDKHPRVEEVLKALEKDRGSLRGEAQRAFDTLLTTVQVEKAKEAQARQRFAAASKRIAELNEARAQYEVLTRKREREEVFYQQVLSKMREYTLNTKDTQQNIMIDYMAEPQPRPIKPNRRMILAASIVLGFGLAIGLAFFVNLLDDSVKSQEDVESFLGLAFLGYIPRIKVKDAAKREVHTHLQPASTPSEGFRTLRATVALARNADRLRSVSVTSTVPEEGKSVFACNYAIVTAQTGARTLLVDADMRRPTVQKAFGLQSPAGLSAYLSENVRNLEEIVHTTEVPNLSVVCCGKLPPNPSELLASPRMKQFLRDAAQHYDRIVLDCPPTTAVADPLIVGALSDGMIYVTKFNKVRRDSVLRSVQRIQDAGIHLIGMVINDLDFEGRHSYYGDHYYHSNKFYGTHYASGTAPGGESRTPAARSRETTPG